VSELWLLDARRETMSSELYARGETAFVHVVPDADGFGESKVFAKQFRLNRMRDEDGLWTFDLQVR
jgi:hypothetical protein